MAWSLARVKSMYNRKAMTLVKAKSL